MILPDLNPPVLPAGFFYAKILLPNQPDQP